MSKLTASDIKDIATRQREVLFRGTEDNGYADSGLFKFLKHVYTKDAHDHDNPVKKLMGPGDDYILIVFLYMLACADLAIPKSRQIRMSWIACTYALWHAMSAPYRHVVYQTKKEDDAFAQTTQGSKNPADGRMDFILQHLPGWLRDPHIVSGKGNLVGTLTFSPLKTGDDGVPVPWYGSKINAIPQGGNQIRQYTPSLVISDESAFQEEYASSRVAVKPAVTGGGQFISVSSVDSGSHFNQTVLDTVDGLEPRHEIHPVVAKGMEIIGLKWPKGMRSWRTAAGVWVLETHYTSDPRKDPARQGAAWVDEAVKGYVGGFESSGWKTEMEIDYMAGGGDPVFPFAKPGSPIFIDSFKPAEIKERMRFYAGYDYGARNPSAFIVWGIDEKHEPYAVWELYEPCLNIGEHVAKIKMCPYWDLIEYVVCDPSITAKNQQHASGVKSLIEQFSDHGLHLSAGRRGADVPMAHRFLTDYWADPKNPQAYITKACPNLWQEVMGLRWDKHVSEALNVRKNAPERIRDKDNHAWDATSYLFDRRPHGFVRHETKSSAGTFGQAARDLRMIAARERSRGGGIHVS